MGRFDISSMRYLDPDHFRVEMGMKNHEMVPLPLISSIAAIHRGATSRVLKDLAKLRLTMYESGKRYDGFRLTNLGYDFLALRALCSRDVVSAVGNQIGVGKESDIYDLVLKFHRLGRISFRKLKEKRDYHKNRHYCSWLYLSRISALKEFSFLKALHSKGFPVPIPLDVCRHTVVMSLINGVPLAQVNTLKDPEALYDKLMTIIVRLAAYDHPNAEFYFNRDVKGVQMYFSKKFHYECLEAPKFEEMKRRHNLDIELEASGFTKQMAKDLNKAYDEGRLLEESSDEEDFEDEEQEGFDHDGKKLQKTERFNLWLKEAQDQVEHLTVEELPDANIQLAEHVPKLINLTQELKLATQNPDEYSNESRSESNNEEEKEEINDQIKVRKDRGKVTDTRSVYSCGSTIAPEDIKRRLLNVL